MMTTIRRRTVLAGLGALGVAAGVRATSPAWADSGSVEVVTGGQARAVVSVPAGATDHARHCASILVGHVAAATGVVLEVVAGEPATDQGALYLDWVGDRAPTGVEAELTGLDGDGFVIAAAGGAIVIVGPTTYGTQFGVQDFLERYLDIRWLAPSDAWTEIPAAEGLIVPEALLTSAPAFGDRILSPYAWPVGWDMAGEWYEWTNRSRLRRRDGALGYGHNLFRVIDPATYGADHPEFFPILNGQRYVPTASDRAGWQPRLSEPGTVDAAVAYLERVFTAQPDLPALSLGINDSGNFSEDERGHAVMGDDGRWSWSDHYYQWVNLVAERVAPRFGDKFLGVLAYSSVEEPPSFDLHPMVRPVVCRDLQAFSRDDSRAQWRALHERWQQRSGNLGTWSYAYGGSYAVPRIQLRTEAAALRELHETFGVDRVHTEMQPEFGEGPKPWVHTRLLWDPTLDPETLILDWCLHAVGAEAGSVLATYFEQWEKIWQERIPGTRWFDLGAGNPYHYFDAPGYLEAVLPADLEEAGRLIDEVVRLAAAGSHRARAEFLQRSFDYYRAVVSSYPRALEPVTTSGRALKLAKTALRDVEQGAEADGVRRSLLEQFGESELTSRAASAVTNGMAWSGVNLYQVWALADHLANEVPDGPVRRFLSANANRTGIVIQRELAQWVLDLADGVVDQRGTNLGFEDGLAGWTLSSTSIPREEIDLSDAHTHGGSARSLRVPGGSRVVLSQNVTDVSPGAFFTSLRCLSVAEVPGVTEPEQQSCVRVYWRLYDTAGAVIERRSGRLFPLADANAGWQEVRMADVLPESIGRVIVYYEFRPMAVAATAYLDSGMFVQPRGRVGRHNQQVPA